MERTILIIIGAAVALFVVFKLISARGSEGESDEQVDAAPVAEVSEPVAVPAVEPGISPEIVAAIAAAIAAMSAENKALVVRSIRRTGGWNRTARTEQVYRF